MYVIIQTLISSIMMIAVLGLSTFAITLIFKTSATTNFAQGMISALGSFMAATLFMDSKINFYLSLALGIVTAFVFGLFVDLVINRNAKNVTPVGKQMITMGIALILIGILPITLQKTQPNLKPLILGTFSFDLWGDNYSVSKHALIFFIIAIVIVVTLFLVLKFSRWGLAVRATASHEKTASMMGINTKMISALSWAIAGGIGALAASLYGPIVGMFNVAYMTPIQVQGFMAAILGGFQTFHGPVVGALLLVISGNLIASGGEQLSLYSQLIVYSLVLLIILIKPLGIFGKKVIKKV